VKAPLLQLDDVSLSFGGLKALSDVSFQINAGEIVGPPCPVASSRCAPSGAA